MMGEAEFGWHVHHGDVEGAVRAIREILAADAPLLADLGERARALIEKGRTRSISCGRVCDAIEGKPRAAARRPATTASPVGVIEATPSADIARTAAIQSAKR
jgi:hypothetical protein